MKNNMFQLDFLKYLKNYRFSQEKANLTIRQWKAEHETDYASFTQGIEQVKSGDLTILFEMFNLMKECFPDTCKVYCVWLLGLITGKHSLSDKCKWAGEYTEVICQCIINKEAWLGIDLQNGHVGLYTSPQEGLLMVHSGTPEMLWEQLPRRVRCAFKEIVNEVCSHIGHGKSYIYKEREQTYKSVAYFCKLAIMVFATSVPEFLKKLYQKTIEEEEPLTHSMYYFVTFDHGLQKMTELINHILRNDDLDLTDTVQICDYIGSLVMHSVQMGVETKASWLKMSKQCEPDVWKEINFALQNVKDKRGKKKRFCSLDELLNGNGKALKNDIRAFLKSHKESINLAYLLNTLIYVKVVRPGINYTTFHAAIETFANKKFSLDVPQKKYGELKEHSLDETYYAKSFPDAYSINEEWAPIFKAHGSSCVS
jgi:hypothetical protein